MRPVFDDAGELASVDVLAALCAVGRGGASGTVRFTGAEGEIVRYGFDRGVLVDVATPPDNAPAEVLIRAGKIQRATYEALTVGDFEDRFSVAVASGVISRREAAWGIKIAAIETLARIAASTEGSYTFAEGPASAMQPAFRLPVDHWILELFLRSSDRAFVLRKIGATDIPVARVDGFAEGFAALGLTADADAVIEGIDGVRTIEKVVKRSRADEFATLKLLAALMTLGLIHPILEAPRPPAPPVNEPEPSPLEPAAPVEAESRPVSPFESDEELGTTSGAADASAIEMDDPDGGNVTAAMALDGDEDAGEPDEPDFEPGPASPFPEPIEPDETVAGTFDTAFAPGPPSPPPDPPPVVNLPLFALTAPEEPATEPVIEREEESAGSSRPPRRGPGWIIAVIAAAALVAAVLLVRRPRTAAVAPAGTRAPAESGSAAVAPREAAPATPAPKQKEKPPPAHPSEIVVSRPPTAPAPSAAAPRSAAKGGGEGRWSSLAEAGRREFEHPGKHRYAIQLELACEDSTLEKAFAADPGKAHLWISPYAFHGRRCYRVLWGRFADLGAARAARGSVPAVFSRDGNRPTVVALGGKTPGAGH